MAVMTKSATVTPVNEAGRGARILARRVRYGWDKKPFAERAGIDRGTLSAVEADLPTVRDTTFADCERALDEIAAEYGFDDPEDLRDDVEADAQPIRLTFHDVYGIGEIIAEGPADRPEELTQAVEKLLEGIRRQQGRQS